MFKTRLKIGILVLLPMFLMFFLAGIVLTLFKVWNPFMDVLGFIPQVLYPVVSVLLTLFSAYIVGVIVTTSAADWLLSRIPFIRKIWGVIKAITDRITFVFKGGYKRVVYEHFGAGTKRWRPAIVIGRTMFHYPDGTNEPMLIVNQPPPNVFDPLWIPAKDTRIILDDVKTFSLYIFSGGFVNPADLHLENWTEAEYEEIPASAQDTEQPEHQSS